MMTKLDAIKRLRALLNNHTSTMTTDPRTGVLTVTPPEYVPLLTLKLLIEDIMNLGAKEAQDATERQKQDFIAKLDAHLSTATWSTAQVVYVVRYESNNSIYGIYKSEAEAATRVNGRSDLFTTFFEVR